MENDFEKRYVSKLRDEAFGHVPTILKDMENDFD